MQITVDPVENGDNERPDADRGVERNLDPLIGDAVGNCGTADERAQFSGV